MDSHTTDEAACARLLLKFFRDLDHFNYDECIAAFTEDGAWERRGEMLRGHSAILEAMQARPRDLIICHQLSNIEVQLTGPDTATMWYVLIGYEAPAPQPGARPIGRLGGIRRGEDRLVRTPQGWRFTEKSSVGVMLGAPMPARV
jgi:hypothetical protein